MLDEETLKQLAKARDLIDVRKNIDTRIQKILQPICEDAVESGDVDKIKELIEELPDGPFLTQMKEVVATMGGGSRRR